MQGQHNSWVVYRDGVLKLNGEVVLPSVVDGSSRNSLSLEFSGDGHPAPIERVRIGG
jgi:hypothetical protein